MDRALQLRHSFWTLHAEIRSRVLAGSKSAAAIIIIIIITDEPFN
jgi:hypothetical protein